MNLYHGSARPLARADIKPSTSTGRHCKGRTYAGFYCTAEELEAHAYACGEAVHLVKLQPDVRPVRYDGDITRISLDQAAAQLAKGARVVWGYDPRGRTEFVVLDPTAITHLELLP